MKTWKQAARDGAVTGQIAGAATTAAIALCGTVDTGSPYAPLNAISHMVRGREALRRNGPSLAYTAAGIALNDAANVMWGVVYEKLFGDAAARGRKGVALFGGAAVAALAYFTDYFIVPKRLRPGFERRLSAASTYAVFGTLAAALGLSGLRRARSLGSPYVER